MFGFLEVPRNTGFGLAVCVRVVSVIAVLVAGTLWGVSASAHGTWGHIHVTAWAIENLPPGELRDFFDDPDVRNAAYFGAVFTDSGYSPNPNAAAAEAYGEYSHVEHFVEAYIQWMIANDPAPFESKESKMRVAFLMGAASHGLQDELFDSHLLLLGYWIGEGDQAIVDPGVDGFLAVDGYVQVIPEVWMPMDVLLDLYSGLDEEVTAAVIEHGVNVLMTGYISEFGLKVAKAIGSNVGEQIPWTRAHYMDPEIPGSLRTEILPTMAYIQAIWARLHDDFRVDDLVIYKFPELPRRLLTGDSSSTHTASIFVFGKGVEDTTLSAALFDDAGDEIPSWFYANRWGGDPGDVTRIMRVKPTEDIEGGEWYTSVLAAGARLVDGTETTRPYEHRYQVTCDDVDDPRCPVLDEIPPPVMRLPIADDPIDEGVDDGESDGGDGVGVDDGAGGSGGCDASGSSSGAVPWLMLTVCLLVLRRRRGMVRRASA